MSLIRKVIEAVHESGGVINIKELSQQLGIQPAALEGILAFCAQKDLVCLKPGRRTDCVKCQVTTDCKPARLI